MNDKLYEKAEENRNLADKLQEYKQEMAAKELSLMYKRNYNA
jgi:hypothetical protein